MTFPNYKDKNLCPVYQVLLLWHYLNYQKKVLYLYVCELIPYNPITMKHLRLIILCGFGLLFAAISSFGQGIKTEKFTFEKKTKNCAVDMSVELPVATDDDVCAKITSQLYSILGNVFSYTLSPYNGNDLNSRAVTEYYFQHFFKAFNNDSDEYAKEYGDEAYLPLEFSYSLEKGYETPLFVVFNHFEYNYGGGAHGAYIIKAYTFSKKDGHIVDKFLDPARDLSSFQPMLDEKDDIPLPYSALYPSEEGIVFYCVEYDAGNGESFTVPYDEIAPFLSKEARELLIGGKDATEELSSIALDLCQYIPDHGILGNAERHMTPEYFQAVNEAFAAPDGCYDGIGESEWLNYFVTGQEGMPSFKVRDVWLIDSSHALADIFVKTLFVEGGEPDPIVLRCIKMTKTGGKWLLDDFENTKQDCQNYVKRLRRKYESGEMLQNLLSDNDLRVYAPEYMESVEAFYQKFGYGEESSTSYVWKDYTFTGSLYNDGHSYGIEMELTESIAGIKGRYRYLSNSPKQFIQLYGFRSSSGQIQLYSKMGKELFILQPSESWTSVTGEWFMYTSSEELIEDSDRNSWKKHLLITLHQKQ